MQSGLSVCCLCILFSWTFFLIITDLIYFFKKRFKQDVTKVLLGGGHTISKLKKRSKELFWEKCKKPPFIWLLNEKNAKNIDSAHFCSGVCNYLHLLEGKLCAEVYTLKKCVSCYVWVVIQLVFEHALSVLLTITSWSSQVNKSFLHFFPEECLRSFLLLFISLWIQESAYNICGSLRVECWASRFLIFHCLCKCRSFTKERKL